MQPATCKDTCGTLRYACGTANVCGNPNTNCGTCPSGTETCVNHVCVVNSCSNGVPDNGETGTDCGGSCKDCLITSVSGGDIFYVAPWGDDTNNGRSLSTPWQTWDKAFARGNGVGPGDLIYFRGGVYYYNSSSRITISGIQGTPEEPIRYFAYPNDNEKPILDGTFKPSSGGYSPVILFNSYSGSRPSNLHLKGLEIRNFKQHSGSDVIRAIDIWWGYNITFENMALHDNDGSSWGGGSEEISNISWINCDAYNNYRPLGGEIGFDGELYLYDGGGWAMGTPLTDGTHYLYGCRVWNGSSGFGTILSGKLIVNNSWSFLNGYGQADGVGIKGFSGTANFPTEIRKTVVNSIFAGDRVGFDRNSDPDRWAFYNNFFYHNGYQGGRSGLHHVGAIYYPGSTNSVFKNNIVYNNTNYTWMYTTSTSDKEVYFNSASSLNQSHNSWNSIVGGEYAPYDVNIQVSDADFVNLDITQLMLPRHANGSLPDITFGHLVTGSDLIDKGTPVGIVPYFGNNPDLGAFEHS
jgi:hypothetical protein